MQNFIVLGLVPGTNFEATFNFWLCVVAGLIGLQILRVGLRRSRMVRTWLVARELTRFIAQYQLAA
jgi:hypothetical protein